MPGATPERPVRPILADVAARAGVSLKTASRALNGEYGVAATTAERVQGAARDLGFRPNLLARSLASRSTSAAVGLVIPSVSDPFMAAVAGAAEHTLAPRSLQLMSTSHGDDSGRQRTLVRALVERRVDALLLVSAPGDSSYLQRELDHGLVVVAADRPLEGVAVDTVTVDNSTGAVRAVRGLLADGHRRIAVVGSDRRLWTLQERYRGYRAALEAAGIPLDPGLVALDLHSSADAQAVVSAMLEQPHPPTAIFAVSHPSGRAAIRAMQAAGVVLDLAVFDEVDDPDLLTIPPRVVVESDPIRLGTACATMILDRLDGWSGPPRSAVLPPWLHSPRGAAVAS